MLKAARFSNMIFYFVTVHLTLCDGDRNLVGAAYLKFLLKLMKVVLNN